MTFAVNIDPRSLAGVNRWFGELDKAQAQANRRALLKAGKKAASLSVKEIAAKVSVKQKFIRRRLKAFPAPIQFRGSGDFVRVWLGLRASIKATDDRRILKDWRSTFQARMPSGHVGIFARRPNPLKLPGPSRHDDPSPAGKPNPDRHSLPIDQARAVLERGRLGPIIFRHARASLPIYEAEFRRLLELNARRAARKT